MRGLEERTSSAQSPDLRGRQDAWRGISAPARDGLLAALGARWRLLTVLVAAGFVCGAAYGTLTPKTYKATASILFDTKDDRPWEMAPSTPSKAVAPDEIETQISILRSSTIAQLAMPAIPPMAEIDEEADLKTEIVSALREMAVVRSVADELGAVLGQAPSPGGRGSEEVGARNLAAFRNALTVRQEGRSRIILVEFAHHDPAAAATAANAVARQYLERERLDVESTYARRKEWVTRRLQALDSEIAGLESRIEARHDALQAALADEGAFATAAGREIEQEWSTTLSRQSDIRAALEAVQGGAAVDDLSAALLGDPFVVRASELEMRQTEVEKELAEARQTYGSKHPRILGLQEELRAVRARAAAERSAAAQTLSAELRVLEQRGAGLEDRLRRMRQVGNLNAYAERKLDALEERMAVKRQLRSRFENVATDLDQAEQRVSPRASLLSPAAPPKRPSGPSVTLTSGLGAGTMLFFGVLLVGCRKVLDRRINQPEDIEQALGIASLGALPRLSRRAARAVSEGSESASWHSEYAESVRMILTSLFAAPSGRPGGCLVCIVSSALPGEGKTLLASTLARYAGLLGKRALHVDTDFRKHRKEADKRSGCGRNEMWKGDVPTNLDVLRLPGPNGTAVKAAFDGSPDFCLQLLYDGSISRYVEGRRSEYDFIVIDTPPILGFSDVKALAPCSDVVLLSVKAHETDIDSLAAAVNNLSSVQEPELRFVLNLVDPGRTRTRRIGHLGPHRRRFRRHYRVAA